MNRLLVGAMALVLGTIPVTAQSLDDLNIQIHGYATQGFLDTTQNNVLTTSSSDGSPAWTEAVVNVTAQPNPKLRIGMQARYFLLGNIGNTITLDWASADYKANDKFGVRFGKVKTPTGLFNEIQDIDPSYMWSLLPQGIYPILSRNTLLTHDGGVVYGTVKLDRRVGTFEYRAFGGERVLDSNDGYFIPYQNEGFKFPNGMNGTTYGGALHWKTPLPGLMVGASDFRNNQWSPASTWTVTPLVYSQTGIPMGTYNGTLVVRPTNEPSYFGRYEKGKIMVAAEHMRLPINSFSTFSIYGSPVVLSARQDQRTWYGMASYKVTSKLSAGLYNSQYFNRQEALGSSTRYSKDWAISGRYDFNEYLYAKAEQHFIDGKAILYDATQNVNGLKPNTKLTILKVGISF